MVSISAVLIVLASVFAVCAGQTHLPLRPVPANSMHFASLGDWGSVNSDQAAVAKQIGLALTDFNASFLLAIGDNFYEDGVVSDTDPQWNTTYEEVYTNMSLDIPWYAILGNHDHHYGRGQGQIDFYRNKRDSRWTMPDYWYSQHFHLQESNVTVHMVFIDTIILSGDGNVTWPTQRKEQYQWIEKTLEASRADWLIVIGHYPVYSGGEHGNTPDLDENLLPLLTKYNVDMYLCGHDHTLQHSQDSKTTTQYFVSGNGAKRGTFTPIKQSLFGVVDPGFMLHTITGLSSLHTQVIDLNGKTIYEYTQMRIPKSHDQYQITNTARSLYDNIVAK